MSKIDGWRAADGEPIRPCTGTPVSEGDGGKGGEGQTVTTVDLPKFLPSMTKVWAIPARNSVGTTSSTSGGGSALNGTVIRGDLLQVGQNEAAATCRCQSHVGWRYVCLWHMAKGRRARRPFTLVPLRTDAPTHSGNAPEGLTDRLSLSLPL